MGIMGGSKSTGKTPASVIAAKGMRKAAKGAQRGGSGIRILPRTTKPAQQGRSK